jgi:LmbE family N-acetylglucosaminyl deacetylase
VVGNKIVVMSPHLDDAIWSLGGYLKSVSKTKNIRIVNIFSQHNFVFGHKENPIKATLIRKKEDQVAMKKIKVKNVDYLNLPEAFLRGYSYEEMFMQQPRKSKDLILEELEAKLKKTINKKDTFLVPSAFGMHIDHYLVRETVNKLTNNCYFYEEMPYSAREKNKKIAEIFLKNKKHIHIPTNNKMKNDHMNLIKIYKSQLKNYHLKEIGDYISEKGFCLWQ